MASYSGAPFNKYNYLMMLMEQMACLNRRPIPHPETAEKYTGVRTCHIS